MKGLMKILFIIIALIFLFVFLTTPKTDCDTCKTKIGSFDTFLDDYEEDCLKYEDFSINDIRNKLLLKE